MNPAGRGNGRWAVLRDRRSLTIVALVALLVAGAGLPVALWLTRPRQAQLLIVNAGGRPTTMIEDGDRRILILNTEDREEALSIVSRLSRALAPDPSIVVAPSDDRFAPALLAVVEQLRPDQVIVAGAPGAAAVWTAIEQTSRRLGVSLRYTGGMVSFDGPTLQVAVIGAQGGDQAAAVVVGRGGANIVLTLSDGRAPASGQLLVTAEPSAVGNADLVITTRVSGPPRRPEVVVERGEVVRVAIEPSAVRIYGGTRRQPAR